MTDSYLQPSLADVRDAVNRVPRSIDGEIPPGAIPFRARNIAPDVAPAPVNVESTERSVSNPHA